MQLETFKKIVAYTIKLTSKDKVEFSEADKELSLILARLNNIEELIFKNIKTQVRQVVAATPQHSKGTFVPDESQLAQVIEEPQILLRALEASKDVEKRQLLYKQTIAMIKTFIENILRLMVNNLEATDKHYAALYDLEHKLQDLIFEQTLEYQHFHESMHPYYEGLFKSFFAPENGKALHVVNVVNGIGDLIHMQNWVAAYEAARPGKSEVIIAYSKNHHSEQNIAGKIAELPDSHPLKMLKAVGKVTLCETYHASIVIKNKLFGANSITNFTGNSEFSSLYGISQIGTLLLAQLKSYSSIGLQCTMIYEIGAQQSLELAISAQVQKQITPIERPHLSSRYKEFTFGVGEPKNGYCGLFFSKCETIANSGGITRPSANLQRLIFAGNAKDFKNTHLLAGYYQSGRSTFALEAILTQKLALANANVILFVSGHNELPEEIKWLQIRINNDKLKIVCSNLSPVDYQDLMRLIASDTRHLFYASGDNTIQDSLSNGKPIIYLDNTLLPADKNIKRLYLSEYLDLLISFKNQCVSTNNEEAILLTEIYNFTVLIHRLDPKHTSVDIRLPSERALKFFADVVTPYLRKFFDLNTNISQIINLESSATKEPLLSPEPFMPKHKLNKG